MEQILCYWPDPAAPALASLRRTALLLKLRLRVISPDQTGLTLGHLSGRKGFEAQEGTAPAVPEPILILDSFTETRMNALLQALGKAKLPRSTLKAVVTAHNVNWTLFRLWQELNKEREAMERGEEPVHGR